MEEGPDLSELRSALTAEPESLAPAAEPETRETHCTYPSHDAARAYFRSLGIGEAQTTGAYSSTDVVRELTAILKKATETDVKAIDLTAKCPTTATADLRPYLNALLSAQQASRQRPDVLFFVMRTMQNTPAYLHAILFGPHNAELHKEPPISDVNNGIAFFRNKQVTIPPRMAPTSAWRVADMIATMMAVGHHGFNCQMCNTSMAVWGNRDGKHVQCVDNMLILDCDHCFHPRCIVNRLKSQSPMADKCPVCGDQLPIAVQRDDGDTSNIRRAEESARKYSETDRWMACLRASYNNRALEGLSSVSSSLRPLSDP